MSRIQTLRAHFLRSICFIFALLFVSAGYAADDAAAEGLSKRSIRKLEAASKRRKNKKPAATAPLETYCTNISDLKKALLKNAYPGHINRSDPRAKGFAFVCGPDCPRKFPVNAYYSDGTQAFRLGYYGVWSGNGRPRAYCAAGGVSSCSAKTVTSNSKKSGRDGKVYLVFDAKKKSCRSAVPGNRNGSPF